MKNKLVILVIIGLLLSVILASCQPPTDGITMPQATQAPPPAEGEGDGITVISDNIYRFRRGLDVCFVYIGVGISCTYHGGG